MEYKILGQELVGVLDKTSSLQVAAVLFIGAVLGGAGTVSYMDQRLDSIEDRVDSKNVVYINGSSGKDLTSLFRQVDQSVVSIRTFGGKEAQGSGFVYDSEGHIITNQHVIEGADRVEVTFIDGVTKKAEVVGSDPYTDLAVLKVNKKNLEPLPLADSDKVEVGQQAVAIGNPFGLGGSMTSGIISQKGRTLRTFQSFSTPNVLQTDAAINPGNSGGPLINTRGEVVGVNTAIESGTGTFSGVGFAIPSNTVSRVAPGLIEEGDYRHPWIGVSGFDVNDEIKDEMNLSEARGFLVVEVMEDSPAEGKLKAGNRTVQLGGGELTVGGDVIVGIEGREMNGINDILSHLAERTEVGEKVNITVIRDHQRKNVTIELAPRPKENQEE